MVRDLDAELRSRSLLVGDLPIPQCVDESASFRCGPKLGVTCVARYAGACRSPRPAGDEFPAYLWLEIDGEVVFRMPTGSCAQAVEVVPFGTKVFLDQEDRLLFRTRHCWGYGDWTAVWALPKRGKGSGFCERTSQRDLPDQIRCQGPPALRKLLRAHLP